MIKKTTWKEAEKQFWTDVEELLIQHYGHPARKARDGIDTYRAEVDRRKLGQVVYNQGEKQAANVIDGIIRDGLPIPSTS
jgi:hypothetical protein